MFSLMPFSGSMFDSSAFWQQVASALAGATLWAQQRANPEQDPVKELIFRLRHPWLDAAKHPLVTLRRKRDRRRAA